MASKLRKPEPTRRELLRWMTAGMLTSVLPMSYASYSTGWISVERRELKLPKWDADGFRVVVLSDLHTDSIQEVEHAHMAIALALAEKPDLIALPGDFINQGQEQNIEYARRSLVPLYDSSCPVVATLGNHDYGRWRFSKVAEVFQNSPIKLLRNEAIEMKGVTVAGLDDGLARQYNTNFLREREHSKSLLTFFHEPDFVKYVPDVVSLQISGHSHGGQICLPMGIPIHTSEGSHNYFEGFYPNAKVPLYVSRGIGTVGPRLRLFCRPEVSVLTLSGTTN